MDDAVGNSINRVGARLASTPEDKRPGAVIFLVITDGEENSSKEFTREKIKEMVKHQTETYKWQFAYLGSDLSTKVESAARGFASTRSYTPDAAGTKSLMNSVSKGVTRHRGNVSRGLDAKLEIDDGS